MRILFSMRHPGALRNFASTLRELAHRGHEVRLAFMMMSDRADSSTGLLGEVLQECPGMEAEIVEQGGDRWRRFVRTTRAAADFVRYGAPEYRHAKKARKRAAGGVRRLQRLLYLPVVGAPPVWSALRHVLAALERAIPADRRIVEYLARHRPDVVLVTPLIDLASDQVEYVKAARTLGIPSGLCVHSWDNLTNKGLIRVPPDRVFVWNDLQTREAVALHGVGGARVVVTGAPGFDHWFDRKPSVTRETFCRQVGLPPEKPFFLYLCSSTFIAKEEAAFVARWIEALRAAPDPRVRDAGILIRPHPGNPQDWQRSGVDAHAGVVRWPPEGAEPTNDASRHAYFDSLFHAAAAIGINTTATIEAAIAGCPVHTVRAFGETQEGTLHFKYLLREEGGPLHVSESLTEHVAALAVSLDRSCEEAAHREAFVRSFVRPRGLARNATCILADEIESLGRMLAQPARPPAHVAPAPRPNL
jgi:hypothetical protein